MVWSRGEDVLPHLSLGDGEDPGGGLRGTEKFYTSGGDIETAIKLHIEHSFGNCRSETIWRLCLFFTTLL